jgi:UDP-N-acetylmuramate--alanine ligase
LYYPEFISWYFRDYKQICIAGSHGKTTTTAMVSHILKDCCYLIGDGSGGYSKNKILVIEACEYKNTFLNYNPFISLVLNVDYDHPDFFKNEEEYKEVFKMFIDKSLISIVNGDDDNLQNLKLECISFGIDDDSDLKFSIKKSNNRMYIYIDESEFIFKHFGIHYAYDFVGAYIIAKLMRLSDCEIKNRLNTFKLPNRRLTKYYKNKITYICDYAHHPTEIEKVYQTLQSEYPNKNIVCFFEPHTYSRTLAFKDDFKRVLGLFAKTYLFRTFGSREKCDSSLDNKIINDLGYSTITESEIVNFHFDTNNIYLFLGAGTIDNILRKILCERK